MWAEFKHTLRRLRGRIIGWSIGLSLYSLMMVFMYDTVLELMGTGAEDLLAAYPPEMMAFIGVTIFFPGIFALRPKHNYSTGLCNGRKACNG